MVKSGVPLCYLSNAFIHIFSSVENHAIKPTHHQKTFTASARPRGIAEWNRNDAKNSRKREAGPILKFSLLNMIN